MASLKYLSILRRRWLVLLATTAVALLLAWVTMPAAAEVSGGESFTATHTLVQEVTAEEVGIGGAGGGGGRDSSGLSLELVALLATTGEVPERVVQRLELDEEPAEVAARVTVTPETNIGVLRFQVTGPDPEEAEQLANAFAEETLTYLRVREQQQQAETLETAQESLANIEPRLTEIEAAIAELPINENTGEPVQSVDFRVLDAELTTLLQSRSELQRTIRDLQAAPPPTTDLSTLEPATAVPSTSDSALPAPTGRKTRLAIALALGLLFGIALALLLERVDTRIRTRKGAERAFTLPVVTEIPKARWWRRRQFSLALTSRPASAVAEAYRMLRLSVQLMPRWILPPPDVYSTGLDTPGDGGSRFASRVSTGDEPAHVILVTSPGPAEGKTSVVANLAASYAEIGKTVLVLDCDFRHPQVHRYLGVEPGRGVSDLLAAGARLEELSELAVPSDIRGVYVVPSGTRSANPGELVGPDQQLVAVAAGLVDIVIIDAGPLLAVNDPAALLPCVDGVVVVARSGKTTAEAAVRSAEVLGRLAAPVLGVTLVGVPRGSLERPLYGAIRRRRLSLPRRGRQNGTRETVDAGGPAKIS